MPIHRPEERLIQARFLLDLFRLLNPLPGVHSGHFEQSVIVIAVVLGELQERPFQASKLSEFLQMPRPTLLRRLKALEADGIIERRDGRYFASERINSPELTARTAQVSALILAAASELKHIRKG